ncbi:hypothetical protein KY289_018809 [Solanum tuberosum]|nr:hypothetical protein KY289_018809 [Solanum tuberosum]
MFDVSQAMYAKLWWRFRTQNNLWSNFLWNKYCKKQIPTLVEWKGGSQIWKHMLENREIIEQHLWWEPKGGNSTIWYDNWSTLGPLHLLPLESQTCHPMRDIEEFLTTDGWDFENMKNYVPEYVVNHVTLNLCNVKLSGQSDKPWWTKTCTGKFSVKSAWELLRQREDINDDFKLLWMKGLPFKFSFLTWRIWQGKVPVAVVMHSWNHNISQLCRCCSIPERETIEHLFLKGEIASIVWNYFGRAAGLTGSFVQLKQSVKKWWGASGNTRLNVVFQAVPIVILWFLWKRRNTILHGGSYSVGKVKWEITDTILKLLKERFNWDFGSNNWPLLIASLEGYKANHNSKIVRWFPPPTGWLKCNTDGASKGNPGPSSAAFCIRDQNGNFLAAKGVKMIDSTNLVAEARAIREGLMFCKENRLTNVLVETDSLVMVNIIEGRWEIPWSLSLEVNIINELMRIVSTRVQHSLREGNTLADFLTNLVFIFAGGFQYNQFQELPNEVKRIIDLDKVGTPHIRRRSTD